MCCVGVDPSSQTHYRYQTHGANKLAMNGGDALFVPDLPCRDHHSDSAMPDWMATSAAAP